ncbi:HECT-domain-containing protein [Microdochium trichocladiopsis]|uniref:HECT-type E3 ubiquitin transferase n=1 Tax=Microdochium trichocladiopsis TaxID=1682393 RepID=A0A9P9BWC5_9PEZI|nr:HECT-domain-containing protein [Microdochium trichocladiopsis]KAH7040662.1 HECT-domain-containing protein [Microdochium trichocladiopsis]
MTGTEEPENEQEVPHEPQNPSDPSRPADDSDNEEDEEDDDDSQHNYDEDDDEDEDDDPFGGFGGPGGPGAGLTSTLRALTGMMSGISSRLRDILNNLRQKGDSSLQLIALQELSEILLVSNEDNLSGHFSPDSFVKELVTLMQPNEFTGEENPEIMLLACRSLANLMEAIPASTANVVYGGAVPVLCQKLLEIQFIDLAEQALSTLEKISVEYPTSIVREGGLTACLSYLDFFATSTQRTAVTTAANCCRNIPEDSFGVIRDVMPILLNVLGSSDQRVVEQASLCVTRIIESFKYQSAKLEELVSVDLLRAVLRLLVPGTTNLISANIHTQFLRVLAITARSSPRLSAELFKLNVVETLYQILTGVSPPSETDDVASKLDSVVIMQALIHRPREQIIETLNVICELLPGIRMRDTEDMQASGTETESAGQPAQGGQRKKTSAEKRLDLLNGCKDEVRRFALILFPTLTDAFSSTVNLSVRQKVLLAQLKMLSNLDQDILVDALKSVPYASFLASILSQQDHPSLVVSAIHSTELLLSRLGDIYRYQVYREGVIAEVSKLAAGHRESDSKNASSEPVGLDTDQVMHSADDTTDSKAESPGTHTSRDDEHVPEEADEDEHDDEDDEGDDDKIEDDQDNGHHDEDGSGSPASSDGSTMSLDGPSHIFSTDGPGTESRIANVAKMFLQVHETAQQGRLMKEKAQKILANLQELASRIRTFYLQPTGDASVPEEGLALFEQLASHFDAEMLESVTSAELLASGLVRVLEEIFSNPDEALANSARAAFLEVFMGRSVRVKPKTSTAESPATPFSVLVHKLQDLLSRSEHFEVLTVHQNTFDGNRSSAASMLAKQIRLRLVADDESDIPRSYRNIMVSIHAIATFKALDDYLRPRISLFERPRLARPRDGLSRALAAMASSAGLPATGRLAERAGSLSALAGPPFGGSSFSDRQSKQKKSQPETSTSNLSDTERDKTTLRRSSRRNPSGPPDSSRPSVSAPHDDSDDLRNALECADEKQMSDDDDEEDTELADTSALDAIVGELDEDLDDEPMPDPSAVSVEVAAGGKVTAMNEDGTRVPTPAQTTSSKPPPQRTGSAVASSSQRDKGASGQQTPTPATSSRPQSYAAAIQAIPQDWHIEFSLDNKVIPNETTIYRAVHKSSSASDDHSSRSAWSAVHSIKFRRVPGPPPAETIGFGHVSEGSADINGVPASLAHHPTTASILRLLNILHSLNANLDDVLVEDKAALRLNAEPLAQFVNTKLTAKLNRQLEEPLIVASNCLPSWSEDLARLYPFLFPFETRHLFLQSTSFGYARSMSRWQNAQQEDTSRRDRRDDRPFLGRLQRQKVRISRGKILESALKVMELYGASQSILEVEYFEEVGTGLGPTLEFYSTVSREFSKKKLKLFRDTDTSDAEEYAGGPNGLFPRPMCEENPVIIHLFKTLGKFVARSMIDSRIIDINFNPIFFRIGDDTSSVKPSLGAIKVVDPGLASSLKLVKKFALAKKAIDEDLYRTAAQKVADTEKIMVDNVSLEDLALDFTLPGYPEIELIPGGSSQAVDIYNVETYLDKVIDMTLGSGVKAQVDAFRAGFSQVFPYTALSAFTPDELVSLFGRVEEDWTLETLMDSIKADHGYNMDSKSVRNLLQTMSELGPAERRDFLQFTTGSPKLPIGGFRSLTPMFTVVCKPSEPPYTSDDYLPSVMTCVNYLKLPDYSSIEIMRKQLFTATREGQGAFHLS